MHKLNYELFTTQQTFDMAYSTSCCLSYCLLVVAARSRAGQTRRSWEGNSVSMKWPALVHLTPLLSLLSLSKLDPDVSFCFHLRGEIARMIVCVCVLTVCVKERARWRERERGRWKESERDIMVWEKRQRRTNGFLWPQMETGIQPNDFIPTSVSHPSISPGLESQNTSSLYLPSTVTVNKPLS